jgi:hypothetical protein
LPVCSGSPFGEWYIADYSYVNADNRYYRYADEPPGRKSLTAARL